MATSKAPRSRYYTNDCYILPSDEEERTRLWKQHHMITLTFENRVILAPVKWNDGDIVLEVGVAGGAWLADAAKEVGPLADVKFDAIDIEGRLFPPVPPKNLTYSVASILALPAEWNDRFTYIHQRLLMGALTEAQWPVAMKELYRVTKPGGWVELSEGTSYTSRPEGRPLHTLSDLLSKLSAARGLKANLAPSLANMLKEVGFEDIEVVKRDIPLGQTAGEIGELGVHSLAGVFNSIKKPVLEKGGFGLVKDEKHFDELVRDVKRQWNEVPGYMWHHYIVYARKPVAEVVGA